MITYSDSTDFRFGLNPVCSCGKCPLIQKSIKNRSTWAHLANIKQECLSVEDKFTFRLPEENQTQFEPGWPLASFINFMNKMWSFYVVHRWRQTVDDYKFKHSARSFSFVSFTNFGTQMQLNFQLVHPCVVCSGSSDKTSTHIQTLHLKLLYGDQFDAKSDKTTSPIKTVFNCITATVISQTNLTWKNYTFISEDSGIYKI